MSNSVTELFGIRYPIVQGGMIWCAGWELASAVSNAGGLGLIGSGSMYPDVFREHVRKTKAATDKPFGVNVPLLYPNIEEHMKTILEEKIPIVFTSAGNPKIWTSYLKSEGVKVVHVVPGSRFAVKAADAGVDAIVAEGFEAGGHNGREETTTLVLIPMVRKMLEGRGLPLIAAGGIGSGRALAAAFALGADGVQIGSRFAATVESSAHDAFKRRIVDTAEGDTMLSLKKVVPVRLIKNEFQQRIQEASLKGASPEELREMLGRGRAKLGMFEGDLQEGELEIGQVAGAIDSIDTVEEVVQEMVREYRDLLSGLPDGSW